MKLLGWMHQKLRQRSTEPFKDFTIGNCCTCLSAKPSLDDPLFYPKTCHSSKPLQQHQSKCKLSISELNPKKVNVLDELSSGAIPELFNGFLAIGTLGSEPIINEVPTPTFGMSPENIIEKEIDVMENDLRLINDELEKFLEAEAIEEGCDESSGRNSYVSIITLCSKQLEVADAEEHGKMEVCPLQGYLLGSSIELPDLRIEAKKEKTSLGELFQMTKTADEYSKQKHERDDMQAKGKNKSGVPLMKKILKKLHVSLGSSTTSADSDVSHSVSTNRKLRKVLRMFHKKIHPERSAEEFKKSYKYETESTFCHGGYNNEDFSLYEDNIRFPRGSMSKGGVQCHSDVSKLPQNVIRGSNFSGNREHWIKTDADCLEGSFGSRNRKGKGKQDARKGAFLASCFPFQCLDSPEILLSWNSCFQGKE